MTEFIVLASKLKELTDKESKLSFQVFKFSLVAAFCLSALPFIIPVNSFAEAGEELLYVRPVKEGIHSRRAGSRIGELFRGTRVKKLQEQEDWVKVSIEGWMRKEKVVALKRPGVSLDGKVFDDVLVVKDFEIKQPSALAKGTKSVFMLLTIENKLARRVNGFKGVLIIKEGDRVVHREPVTYELEPIDANSDGSVIFSWDSGSKVFDILTAGEGEGISVKLGKVTLR